MKSTVNKTGLLGSKWLKNIIIGLAMIAAPMQAAFATVILTGDRNAINPGYFVNWGAVGPDGTPTGSPFTLGEVTVSGASGFTVFSGSTYNADFTPTDEVLALFDGDIVGGIFSITFAHAVQAAGAQIQANAFGAFSGWISAYDASNVLLGTYLVSGINGGNGTGSAVFAGLVSTGRDIMRIDFSSFGDGAAINGLSVSVPEPSTWLMLIIGLGFIAFARKRGQSV